MQKLISSQLFVWEASWFTISCVRVSCKLSETTLRLLLLLNVTLLAPTRRLFTTLIWRRWWRLNALENCRPLLVHFRCLSILIRNPFALLNQTCAITYKFTLTILFVICKLSFIVITICVDKTTIAVHLMVEYLALVNGSIVNHIATNSVDIIIRINLTNKVWINRTFPESESGINLWNLTKLLNVGYLEGAKL